MALELNPLLTTRRHQWDIEPDRWSLTWRQLQEFFGAISNTGTYQRLRQKGEVTITSINSEFVVPWTKDGCCSVSLRLNPEGLAADVMVSHGKLQ